MTEIFQTPEAEAAAEAARQSAISRMGAELALAANGDRIDLGDERDAVAFLSARWHENAIRAYLAAAMDNARERLAAIRSFAGA